MKSCVAVSLLVLWSLVRASAGETFADRLAALESRLQSEPTNTLILFQLGDLCHDEGANNDAKAVILADGYFKRLLVIDPDHAMARVMHGSVLTMKARDELWPITQLKYVKAGNREMDAAVTNFHMPDILNRGEIVQEDLAWLWQQALLPDTSLNVGQKQTIALYYGQTRQKKNQLDEALQIWRAGLALAPKSPGAARLKEQLTKHTGRPK
jgi:tetratricopeptide (TPR) repeat protein